MAFILSRDPAFTVSQLSTHGTAKLLSKNGEEIKAPLAPLLGASSLVRSIVAESHLHPGVHGPLVLSVAVTADVLVSVSDILGTGESDVSEENIEEVVQVLNSLGVEANLSQSKIHNEFEYVGVATNEENIKLEIVFEPVSHEETEGDAYEAMDNLLNVATNKEDIKEEMGSEPTSDEEILSEGDVSEAVMDNSLKECFLKIEKIAEGSPNNPSCPNNRVENPYDHSSSYPSDLERDSRIHTGEEPHICSICNLTCSNPSALLKHYRIHTGEKPFTCKICNLSFSQKCNLLRHDRIHKGEKPFKCSICSYSCTRLSNLRRHGRIHTGEKPYTCNICNVSFSQSCHLRQHVRVHTGEKQFKCKICSYSCNDPSNFRRHRRIHTGEKNHGTA